MRIRFEINCSVLPQVKEIAESINNRMAEFGYDDFKAKIGFKIGEVTVEVPETETNESVKLKLEKAFKEKLVNQDVWLKEVAYEHKTIYSLEL